LAAIKPKKVLSTLAKVGISATAVGYMVYRLGPDDRQEILDVLAGAQWAPMVIALLLFNASKWLSAIRLNRYFGSLGLNLDQMFNLKLYYLGMFYNLFLPGGIGGDGYKVYYLHRRYQVSTKGLIGATLLDRISGAAVLGMLALTFASASTVVGVVRYQPLVLLGLAFLAFPLFWWFHSVVFQRFHPEFAASMWLGLGVQLSQVACAACLLWSVHAPGSYLDYFTLFLVSSVVAALPITIGGIGARELVMLEGVAYFASLSAALPSAMAFSILFFLVTAISSLVGLAFVARV
jgi:uncharacterized membrane protein YbhN (UPF0104 family)